MDIYGLKWIHVVSLNGVCVLEISYVYFSSLRQRSCFFSLKLLTFSRMWNSLTWKIAVYLWAIAVWPDFEELWMCFYCMKETEFFGCKIKAKTVKVPVLTKLKIKKLFWETVLNNQWSFHQIQVINLLTDLEEV